MTTTQLCTLLTKAAEQKLGLTNLAILTHLHGCSDHRDYLSSLAHAVGISTAAITGQIDRLESFGLLTRTPNPFDRRGIFAALTHKSLRLFTDLGLRTETT